MSYSCMPFNDEPFFFDGDDVHKIADERTISLGLKCFKENRVLEIDQDEKSLWAEVEDEDFSDIPLEVQIDLSSEGKLFFSCDCNESEGAVCLHQVAVLNAFADQCQEVDGLLSAADTAIKDRIKRGKSEVLVEAESGEPWFGSWRASSVNAHFPRSYRVTIRSLRKRANFCNCPDFTGNQLGTCKHIEAALHKIKKHPEYETFKSQPAPFPYVYLDWSREEAPHVILHRSPDMAADLQFFLDDYFGADGIFTGRMPDDFFRFVELADERGDVHIGEDALGWARHLASEASHRLRAAEIRRRIENSRGRLPGIKARLYPYQIQGTAFLAGTGRALLADDMGLGKTLQAIAAAVWLKEHEGVKKILIICPASLKQQWAREIDKFTDLQSQIIQGPPAKRGVQYRRQVDFFILNYELVLRDLSVMNEILRPDLIIMDEAQRIKNWRTKIASAVKLIPCRYAFVLTGTPLENRLEDLYSLMQVVNPKILGPLWRYMVDFHVTDERAKVLGYRNLSLLRQRLEPVMLRRDRSLVSEQLPARITQRLDVGMTGKQIEIHDAAMSNAGRLATIARRRPLTPSEQNRLMAALQQARMACNAAGLVDKETEGSPKLDELVDILDEICLQSGLKAVVFSQWELMTQMVEKRLRRMGLGYVRLHGGVPTAKRGELMDRFREDDAVQVFISTDAGGVGLNLQSGSALINLDVPWNPAVLEQRNARIHRLGQTRTVQIITMVAADSYEEQVLSLVNTKQNLFDNVVKEDATEDVVGVSKKLLETLIDELAEKKEPFPGAPAEESESDEGHDNEVMKGKESSSVPDNAVEEAIRSAIEQLQENFGPRIERILGSRGGLIVVLDQVDGEAEGIAVRLSETVPVALIDPRTLQSLSRLGTASPLAETRTYFNADEQMQENATGPSRLSQAAMEKLKAARLLVEQNLGGSAFELLLSALLAAAADRLGLGNPPTTQEAGVWIYSEALPSGAVNQEEAALIMRAISLGQASSLPHELLAQLLEDVAAFVE
ncbi:MAG: DEAD/DEAH box helicase [Desulfobulbaceae bacterium]|nr:DEAD/DEAH box helicase [Desulfobulbaceae bacterium]